MTGREKSKTAPKTTKVTQSASARGELPAERLGREWSTTTILLHQAVAARLGLTGTDHKYLMLIAEGAAAGRITPGDLAAATGLTSGGVTVMLDRLEAAGFITRKSHPDDRRQVVIAPVARRLPEVEAVFAPLRRKIAKITADYAPAQLKMIAEFMERTIAATVECTEALRAETANETSSSRLSARKFATPSI